MKNTFFTKQDVQMAYQVMDNRSYSTFSEVSAILSKKLTDREAAEKAETILNLVAFYTNQKELTVEEEKKELFRSFLENSPTLTGFDRIQRLHELNFAFGFYDDPRNLEATKKGETFDELFKKYYSEALKNPENTEEVLIKSIMDKLYSFNISYETMNTVIDMVDVGEDTLFTAKKISMCSNRIKCIAAAEIYLKGECSVEEATMIACVSDDVKELSLAIENGKLAIDDAVRATKTILGAVLDMAVAACAIGFFCESVPVMVIGMVVGVLAGVAGTAVENNKDDLAVHYAVAYYTDEEDSIRINALKGLQKLRDKIHELTHKNESSDTVFADASAYEEGAGLFNGFDDEEHLNSFCADVRVLC